MKVVTDDDMMIVVLILVLIIVEVMPFSQSLFDLVHTSVPEWLVVRLFFNWTFGCQ